MSLSTRRAVSSGIVLMLGIGATLSVARADLILHEYFRPDPAEDLALRARTSDGSMSAAIQTQSGAISAPVADEPRRGDGTIYGSDRESAESGESYRMDSDTTQPPVVRYDDPFTPEIMPFKRQYAFDAVSESFELTVQEPALTRVDVGGEATDEEDQFYADLDVQFASGGVARIPTVGPGTRALGLRTSPPTAVELLRDGADNWFVRSTQSGRVRVTMQLAIDRGTFGSTFAAVAWSRLARTLPTVPREAREAGRRVAEAIGVTGTMSPRAALEVLVSHFRGFAPSAERPSEPEGARLFEEIVLSKKGVCRHRSHGFVVTALSVGIPARFAHNEAHAWVEVFDSVRWHRVDLGGAAGRVDSEVSGRPSHVTPRDPYRWPPDSDSGAVMADRAREAAPPGVNGQRSASQGSTAPGFAAEPSAVQGDDDDTDERPRSSVQVSVGAADALRGGRVPVSGIVISDGEACALVRVDLELRPRAESGRTANLPLGTLVTGTEGRYEGRVVVPYGVPVGDYDVVATTPGGVACGRGESQ